MGTSDNKLSVYLWANVNCRYRYFKDEELGRRGGKEQVHDCT